MTPKKEEKFSITGRLNSFKYAFKGILWFLKYEHNSRIHLLSALIAIGLGFYFEISALEWIFIICVIAMVFISELFNTAIEHIANFISPEFSLKIGLIKDISSAAVLIAALTSILVALVIFIPYIIESGIFTD